VSNSVLVQEGSGVVVQIENGTTVLETGPDSAAVVVEKTTEVLLDQLPANEVVVDDTSATVIETLYVLPTETIPEEEQVYAKRTDFNADQTIIYRGEAAVGTLESEAAWRIRRLTIAADDDVTEEWANGNANFTNTWLDHLILPYS
jgi:hypothetical protein